jgi:hypothetical protein
MGRAPWTTRLAVEDCRIQLCTKDFQRDGVFNTPSDTRWRRSWLMPPSIIDSLEFERTWNGLNSTIRIYPQARIGQSRPMAFDGQTIRLSRRKLHWGGHRHWFVCMCGKRVGKLYLPYGAPEFRCRTCYNLTYRSSQQHDKRFDGKRRPYRRRALGNKQPGYGPLYGTVECPDFLKDLEFRQTSLGSKRAANTLTS